MATKKIYTVIRSTIRSEREVSGTLDELTEYFSYTLEIGNSRDSRISRKPKTIKSLINAINKSFSISGRYYDCVTLKEVK
ncbi:hypothetical protein [Sangeribacter muris]|jgi:hypothetical protein|uniref:hypothetical protein n=1 Tax=Sangeribacter muris TaxID=2880703 RepID=UPI00244E4FE8|nr:hypothetical protein [Sangeribacter muris]